MTNFRTIQRPGMTSPPKGSSSLNDCSPRVRGLMRGAYGTSVKEATGAEAVPTRDSVERHAQFPRLGIGSGHIVRLSRGSVARMQEIRGVESLLLWVWMGMASKTDPLNVHPCQSNAGRDGVTSGRDRNSFVIAENHSARKGGSVAGAHCIPERRGSESVTARRDERSFKCLSLPARSRVERVTPQTRASDRGTGAGASFPIPLAIAAQIAGAGS